MLKTPSPPSADDPWPADELARFNRYMSGEEPLWEPPDTKAPGVGHNGSPPDSPSSFQDDADAVVRLGPIVTSFKRLGLAIRDPRCHKPHLRVLYNIMERLNRAKGTAFPNRRTVAEEEGLEFHTVENVLYDLRRWGHIDWEKRADPRHKGRLLHYTLPVIRWSEDQIAQAIYALRGESTRPNGYSKYPSQRAREVPAPTGTPGQSTRPNGGKSTRPGVCSNLLKELEDKTASRKRPAPRTRLPLDWAPTPQDRTWAAANFIATDQQISIEAEKFGNYHRGKGSSMADWGAAWRTWWGNGFHKLPRRLQADGAAQPSSLSPQERADELRRLRALQ